MASEFTKIIADGLPSTVMEFFTPVEYAKISDLEKKRLINLRLNYEALRSAVKYNKKPSTRQKKLCVEEKINDKKAKRLPLHTKKMHALSEDKCVTYPHNHAQKTDIRGRNHYPGMNSVSWDEQKDRVYSCSLCYLSFSLFEYLRRHMRSKHGHKYLEFLQRNVCLDVTYQHGGTKASETQHNPGDGQVTDLVKLQIRSSYRSGQVTDPSLEKSQSQPSGDGILLDYGNSPKPLDSVPGNRKCGKPTMGNEHDVLKVGTELIGKQSDSIDGDTVEPNLRTQSVKKTCKCAAGFACTVDLQGQRSGSVDTQYRCCLCGFSCFVVSEFKRHSRQHGGERPYKCDVCSVSFSEMSGLTRHYRRHTGERPYKCDVCFVSFSEMSGLTRHYRSHTGERPYKCDVCSVSFSQLFNLKSHYRTHTGERPYKCDVCSVSFPEMSGLTRHYRRHTGERPYKCDVCFVSFSQLFNLKRHYRRHTGERPYKCDICSLSFSRISTLRSHYRRHTGEKPYTCSACSVSCTQQSTLTRHYRRHATERSQQM